MPYENKIGTIILCHYLEIGTNNSVSLTRKVQSHKIKRHIVAYKDARFITLFQICTYDFSKLLLV